MDALASISIINSLGETEQMDQNKINLACQEACEGLPGAPWNDIAIRAQVDWYNNITTAEIQDSVIMSAKSLIETHPDFAYAAARLLLRKIYKTCKYQTFSGFLICESKADGIIDPTLVDSFNLPALEQALELENDKLFKYVGIQMLFDRYLVRDAAKNLCELPQWFWMRISMGVALAESGTESRTAKAIEFYRLLSKFLYIPSTPTLFNAGTKHSQLSSCYLNIVEDDLHHIFKSYGDCAQLSKYAGGVGTYWGRIRGTNSRIAGTNGESQGLIPWLKIFNDTALAVNQGGKRKGSFCAYIEPWHLDYPDFIELRKNVGDDRRRAHDINTASWIPDLFMERMLANSHWTLFCPNDVSDLPDLYGTAFNEAYEGYEKAFDEGKINGTRMQAKDLWRKMLSMLFETGHPWITFKDACNIRNPQSHAGVIHSSNLCTEITLNTSEHETAVCNLGSVNIARHINDGQIDWEQLRLTIRTAIRMLDNVIDVNFYPTKEAEHSNSLHRPIGLGIMGYQDALHKLGIPVDTNEHLQFANTLYEFISYTAIRCSMRLAHERGKYQSFEGSDWAYGVLPIDTHDQLLSHRDPENRINIKDFVPAPALDWDSLRQQVIKLGMRNSVVMAIAPTASISFLVGASPCIEPTFKNLFVTSNLSGEFTMINENLVRDLEKLGLWNEKTAADLKAYDGDLKRIEGIPKHIIDTYKEVFDIDQQWLLKAAAVRGLWIDQAQSLNLFVKSTNGKLLNDLYTTAWKLGLKTTYYLRSLGASQVEKSTVDTAVYGNTHKRNGDSRIEEPAPIPQCRIDEPDCEACQ